MARTPPRLAPWPEPLAVPHDAERPFHFLSTGFGNDRRTLANNRPLQTFELTRYRHPAPLAIAASSAIIAAPSSVNRAAVSSSCRNRASCQSRRSNTASRAVPQESIPAAHAPVCAAAPPVVTPTASGTKLWFEYCLFIQTWIPPNTRLPLVWFQIARSGAFYFAFPYPAACPRFGQYAPKTSRTGSAVSPYRPGRRG